MMTGAHTTCCPALHFAFFAALHDDADLWRTARLAADECEAARLTEVAALVAASIEGETHDPK